MTPIALALTVLACGGGKQTVGQAPEHELGLTEFTATSHTGEPRTTEDLRGKPSAIWFYPAAGTAG